ncbi:MAG: asparagine synthase-related protein, partial [Bacteroidota bacterium]
PWLHRSPAQVPAFAKVFFGRNLGANDPAISHRPRWDAASAVAGMLSPELRAAAVDDDVTRELLKRMPRQSSEWDSLGRSQWLEMTTLLEGYILSAQGDRMLMANSVEGRFPFLDRDLVDFAGQLPARYKLMGLDEKHILKKAFGDMVPPGILARPKQPYRAPDAASFVGKDEPDWVADLLESRSVAEAGLFNPIAVQKLLEKARKRGEAGFGNSDNMRLVGVLSGMLWYRQMIAGQYSSHSSTCPETEPTTIIDRVGA